MIRFSQRVKESWLLHFTINHSIISAACLTPKRNTNMAARRVCRRQEVINLNHPAGAMIHCAERVNNTRIHSSPRMQAAEMLIENSHSLPFTLTGSVSGLDGKGKKAAGNKTDDYSQSIRAHGSRTVPSRCRELVSEISAESLASTGHP